MTQGAFRGDMTRIVQSFSVPDGSVAHAKLRQWKEEGSNVSAVIQMLIESENTTARIEALRRKVLHLAAITKDGKTLSKADWEAEFMLWGVD